MCRTLRLWLIILIHFISISNHLNIYNILLSLLDIPFCLLHTHNSKVKKVKRNLLIDLSSLLLISTCNWNCTLSCSTWWAVHKRGWWLATSSCSWGSSNSALCSTLQAPAHFAKTSRRLRMECFHRRTAKAQQSDSWVRVAVRSSTAKLPQKEYTAGQQEAQ